MNIISRALGRSEKSAPANGKKHINLALQGGGAHGAFTWGVLDDLLHDGRIEIEGISGTSAGAVNAVMVADGLLRGGPEEARKRLANSGAPQVVTASCRNSAARSPTGCSR